MPGHGDDVQYGERAGVALNEAATATLQKSETRFDEVDYVVTCPVCFGTVLVTEFEGGTYRFGPDVEADTAAQASAPPGAPVAGQLRAPTVAMACGCGRTHPEAPDGVTGCGALWEVPR